MQWTNGSVDSGSSGLLIPPILYLAGTPLAVFLGLKIFTLGTFLGQEIYHIFFYVVKSSCPIE